MKLYPYLSAMTRGMVTQIEKIPALKLERRDFGFYTVLLLLAVVMVMLAAAAALVVVLILVFASRIPRL